jgi:GSH-dependent disulfide-bond oxidoreductase
MLELYHWEPNSYFLKPLIALHEKQVPFVSRWFDPAAFEQYEAGFPRDTESTLHLEREGPVLVHDGRVISNSSFMLEYIAAAFPGVDLTPGDAFQHYRIHAWGQVMTAIGADICILGCAKYLVPRLQERDAAALQAQLARVEPLERRLAWSAVIDGKYDDSAVTAIKERLEISLQRVERQLTQSAWLAGPDYSIADIDAFALLAALPSLAPELVGERSAARLADFLRRMHERKAVQAALALSRSGWPFEAFVPGAEPSRWG